jgi:predicted glutamine amidotransferase
LLRPTSRAARFAASSKRDEAPPFPRHDDPGICRWLAYSGSPVLVEELLYNRKNSLIVQSLHSRLGAEETNGDGFGLGWYGEQDTPGVFRSIEPAWNDRNLRELSRQISSGLVFAHIRASTGSPVQQTNCHPFRHGRWLFMHNGFLDGFHDTKRDLVLAVDPALYPDIEGTTDTELMFHLALTFGLKDDPPKAVARMVGFVEATGHAHGIEFPFQGTIATTDGERIWGFRYSSEGASRSLFFSTDLPTLRELYPNAEEIPKGLDDESRLVVSEPLGDLPGVWNEVPEASYGVIQPGQDEMHPFVPKTDTVPA